MSQRPKYDELAGWQRMPISRQCVVDLARDVYFVDGSRADHISSPDLKQQRYDQLPQVHEDGGPMSVCYQYVTWLNGTTFQDKDAVHAMYANIEIWTAPWGDLYFYRTPDLLGLPNVGRNAILTARHPQPCQQVTLNLLDPDLAAKIQHWRIECLVENVGRIRKVVAEGPLSFQEPPGYDWDQDDQFGPQVKFENLSSILQLGNLVELPSVESQTLTLAYESATGSAITLGNESYYVPNLPALPTIRTEEVRIGAPAVKARSPDQWLWPVLKLVDAGVLNVRRFVFKYGIANYQDTTRMIMDPLLSASSIPVYIAVDEIDDDILREIESTGVRNFIVPERFQLNSRNDAYRVLVRQADRIIYRPFYGDSVQ